MLESLNIKPESTIPHRSIATSVIDIYNVPPQICVECPLSILYAPTHIEDIDGEVIQASTQCNKSRKRGLLTKALKAQLEISFIKYTQADSTSKPSYMGPRKLLETLQKDKRFQGNCGVHIADNIWKNEYVYTPEP